MFIVSGVSLDNRDKALIRTTSNRPSSISQERQSQREYVSGESHYLWGHRYLLNVINHNGAGKVEVRNKKYLDLYVRDSSTNEQRERTLTEWYREQIKARIPDLIVKCQPIMGVTVNEWDIKVMRTK